MGRSNIPTDRRLLGTWKSDRRKTFEHFRPKRGCSAKGLAKFKGLFGKLVIHWTRQRVRCELNGETWSSSYRLIARDDASVVVEFEEPYFPGKRLQQIQFQNDHYWIALDNITEWFRRLS